MQADLAKPGVTILAALGAKVRNSGGVPLTYHTGDFDSGDIAVLRSPAKSAYQKVRYLAVMAISFQSRCAEHAFALYTTSRDIVEQNHNQQKGYNKRAPPKQFSTLSCMRNQKACLLGGRVPLEHCLQHSEQNQLQATCTYKLKTKYKLIQTDKQHKLTTQTNQSLKKQLTNSSTRTRNAKHDKQPHANTSSYD